MNFAEKLASFQLVAVSICFILGIALSFLTPSSVTLVFSVTFSVVLFLFCIVKRHIKTAFVVILAIFLQAGIFAGDQAHISGSNNADIDDTFIGEQVVILGKIRQIYGYNGQTSRFDLDTKSLRTKTKGFAPYEGVIRFKINDKISNKLLPGSGVAVRAKLKKPHSYQTPGSFDYQKYLARQGIYLTADISSALHIQKISFPEDSTNNWKYTVKRLRQKIIYFIDNCIAPDEASVYKAILTGDRSTLTQKILEAFKKSGCLHILAVSGLHISILGLIFFTFFFWILRRSERLILKINTKKTAVLLTLPLLFFYMALSGGKTPVLRAFVMSMLVILAICSNKKHSISTLIAFASLIILTISPDELFSPSFQLTFSAVISIALATRWLISANTFFLRSQLPVAISRVCKWLTVGCGVSLAASLGTAPLLLYHFNRVSLVGVFSNLIVEPLLCLWSLTIGFFALPFIFIQPFIAELLLQSGAWGITLALKSVVFFSTLPFASFYLPTPPIFLIFFYYLCFFTVLMKNNWANSAFLRSVSFTSLLLTIILFCNPSLWKTHFPQKESQISFLDVGHGSCAFIELPSGRKILIDGGSISSPGFDIGERVIAPFLWHNNVKQLDEIIITHPDSDHFNGIPFIIEQFNVKRIWLSDKTMDTGIWSQLLLDAEKFGTQIRVPLTGEYIFKENNISLQVLANTVDSREYLPDKNNGLIIKYNHENFAVLFPGDISATTEHELVEQGIDLKADILLASHHGSATSNTKEFLLVVKPQDIVVSAGRSGRSLYPSTNLLKECAALGLNIYPTYTAGTITATNEKGKYELHTSLKF